MSRPTLLFLASLAAAAAGGAALEAAGRVAAQSRVPLRELPRSTPRRAPPWKNTSFHTPEFPPYAREHDRSNVAKALAEHGISYPNAQDNDRQSWDLYRIRYWPSYVLIDRKGNIRHEGYGEFHVGDRHHELWDARIRALLEEP